MLEEGTRILELRDGGTKAGDEDTGDTGREGYGGVYQRGRSNTARTRRLLHQRLVREPPLPILTQSHRGKRSPPPYAPSFPHPLLVPYLLSSPFLLCSLPPIPHFCHITPSLPPPPFPTFMLPTSFLPSSLLRDFATFLSPFPNHTPSFLPSFLNLGSFLSLHTPISITNPLLLLCSLLSPLTSLPSLYTLPSFYPVLSLSSSRIQRLPTIL